MREAEPGVGPDRDALRADCSRCVGLCCVALAFSRSADFAVDKEAGEPCRNLAPDDRCTIHARLRTSGFAGCTVYDCLGAGQKVTQLTFGGRSWRDDPATASSMFAAFGVVRGLHELLWYLTEALELPVGEALRAEVTALLVRVDAASTAPPAELAVVDGAALQGEVAAVLRRVSTAARGPGAPDLAGAQLVGVDRRGADLRRACLRGALLVGADLREADLRGADLLGADLRGADLAGADLTGAFFCTPMQVAAARGDRRTRLPEAVGAPPEHWLVPSVPPAPPEPSGPRGATAARGAVSGRAPGGRGAPGGRSRRAAPGR